MIQNVGFQTNVREAVLDTDAKHHARGTRRGEGQGPGQVGVPRPVPHGSQEAEYRVFPESLASKDKPGTEKLRRDILTVKY